MWLNLVKDMAAAGIPLQQVDSRAITVAAGYENDLATLERESEHAGKVSSDHLFTTIRLKASARKDLLAALIAIGGTPVARLRARISPEEKPKTTDDPWATI